jgi:hypothetical protein
MLNDYHKFSIDIFNICFWICKSFVRMTSSLARFVHRTGLAYWHWVGRFKCHQVPYSHALIRTTCNIRMPCSTDGDSKKHTLNFGSGGSFEDQDATILKLISREMVWGRGLDWSTAFTGRQGGVGAFLFHVRELPETDYPHRPISDFPTPSKQMQE